MKTLLIIALLVNGAIQERITYPMPNLAVYEDIALREDVRTSWRDDVFPGHDVIFWCETL